MSDFLSKCAQLEKSLSHLISMASSRTYSLRAASEDLSAFKSCRFQALLPDCSQSPWPHAKLFLDLLSTANSLEKQACPRPPTLAVKSVLCIVWHERVHLSVFLSPHHSLIRRSPTAVLTACGSQTHQSRTEALGQDPNIGSFLDPLKLVEMERPLCQSVLQQNDCFRTMDKFQGKSHEIRCPLALFGLLLSAIDLQKALFSKK